MFTNLFLFNDKKSQKFGQYVWKIETISEISVFV